MDNKEIHDEELVSILQYAFYFYKMLGIPVLICQHQDIIKQYKADDVETELEDFVMRQKLNVLRKTKSSHMGQFDTERIIVYGVAYDESRDISIFFGPCRTNSITVLSVKKFFENDKNFDMYKDTLYQFLMTLPIMNIKRFAGFFNMMNMYLTGSTEKFSLPDLAMEDFSRTYNAEIAYLDSAEMNDQHKLYSDSEKRILFYVKNGMVGQIDNELKEASLNRSVVEINKPIRYAKNSVILGIGLVSREALKVGVDSDLCFHMVEVFCDQVESSSNLAQLGKVRYEAVCYFAEKVEQMNIKDVTNPLVLRIVKYINSNAANQITCDEISRVFHVNRTYISTCFKKEMGMGIVDYINRQKIIMAKQMLKFSNKTLAEISYSLSFSSQAYFTKIFKNITGMTPLEYKEEIIN